MTKITSYRIPGERLALVVTLFVVLAVIALTAAATVCASGLFVLAFFIMSFYLGRAHHQELLSLADRVTPHSLPELNELMPPFEGTDAERRALAEYLGSLGQPAGAR